MEFDQAALACQTKVHLPSVDFEDLQTTPITHGGSGRIFYRLRCRPSGKTYILMHYDLDRADNPHFVPVTAFLGERLGVSVPRLYAFSEADRLVWLEDLGESDLWSQGQERWPFLESLYRQALDEVWKIHQIAECPAPCTLEPPFDERLYQWEQSYFIDHFLRHQTRLSPEALETLLALPEWKQLAEALAALPRFLVHRDFQSRNVMVRRGKVYLIDYQGLRWGRPEYDLASLLLDPYVDLGKARREHLLGYYHATYRRKESWASFYQIYLMAAAQRLMQALGAYGNLGRNLGKTEFLDHIPTALQRLREVLAEGDLLPRVQDALRDEALVME